MAYSDVKMSQGDIYTIDVILWDTAQKVSIVKDSIVLNAVATYSTVSHENAAKYCDISLINRDAVVMQRFFYKEFTGSQDWKLIELPAMKKLKLNAGDILRFIAYSDAGSPDHTFLNARITLMEV